EGGGSSQGSNGKGGGGSEQASRLAEPQRAIDHLEAFPSLGGDGDEFAAERPAALRAKKGQASAAQAADKEAGMMPAGRLRRAANAVSKAERKAAGARRAMEVADAAVAEAEAAAQAAADRLEGAEDRKTEARERRAALEEEAAAAKATQERLQVSAGDLEATRVFLQLCTLPAAHSAGNFARACELTAQQLQAAERMFSLQEPAVEKQPRERWGDCCPIEGGAIDSDSHAELEVDVQPTAERGQAERRGPAAGPWPRVPQGAVRELVAEASDVGPLATAPAGNSAAAGGAMQR
ncbi:unnamed protein product, partial [Prorocentrum cordatum]